MGLVQQHKHLPEQARDGEFKFWYQNNKSNIRKCSNKQKVKEFVNTIQFWKYKKMYLSSKNITTGGKLEIQEESKTFVTLSLIEQ